MSGVILVIDELIDQGILMHTNSAVILNRIKTNTTTGTTAKAAQAAVEEPSAGLFSSVFSSARSQLAKSMGM